MGSYTADEDRIPKDHPLPFSLTLKESHGDGVRLLCKATVDRTSAQGPQGRVARALSFTFPVNGVLANEDQSGIWGGSGV
jgi:hypothetical protein